jgi:hypothetical protein
MLDAARWLWFEFGLAANLCGQSPASACGLVCGAGSEDMASAA